MSIKLMIVLLVLVGVNQAIGTTYGWWKEGFDKTCFLSGLYKIGILLLGYGALAFAAYYAAEYVPSAEYVSGILIEPIARYFTKICEKLRSMLAEPAKKSKQKDAASDDLTKTS